MLLLTYAECSTSKKAKKHLNENNIEYVERDIEENSPNYIELKDWHVKSGLKLKKLFDTKSELFKELKLNDKFSDMSEEEQFELLEHNATLLKCPILVLEDSVLVGFKKSEWNLTFFNNTKGVKLDEKTIKENLKSYNEEAEKIIENEDAFEKFIQRLENKLKIMPIIGEHISTITCFVSLVRSYVKKEYTDIPLGSIIGIVSALAYIVSPIDIIPDNIPVAGQVDDIAVLLLVYKFVKSDVDEYKKWRIENGKQLVDEM